MKIRLISLEKKKTQISSIIFPFKTKNRHLLIEIREPIEETKIPSNFSFEFKNQRLFYTI